jgi:hypothetical protein
MAAHDRQRPGSSTTACSGPRLGDVDGLPVSRRPLAVEREAALERIQRAYADELISYDELEQRVDGVLSAATGDEFVALVAGLPAVVVGDRALAIAAVSGRIRRLGEWRVPRRIRIESEYGKVQLDLSRAQFDSAEVEIVLQLTYGWARIIVPRSADVDLDGVVADWKQPSYRGPRQGSGSGPLVRILGHMGYGRLKVRHARPARTRVSATPLARPSAASRLSTAQ